ncbi:MAG TPA: 1-deoxy-D-xylulose-5-phosphate reductoisomerase [Xanthomonadaceae bacterium]|nr:1-deoxy-D-xylulose-5-phosphate reductoisomerase [Xanthomonadaceae bacterium]
MRRVAILGASGSIGASALDVAARHPDRFQVVGLTAHRKAEAIVELCRRFRPHLAALADPGAAAALRERLHREGVATEVLEGPEGVATVAADAGSDTVVAAVVGAAGLEPALAAAHAGKRILLANKEAVVLAGALLKRECAANSSEIIPIDSEHNAIFQCLPQPWQGHPEAAGVARVILTASGGPFRGQSRAALEAVTPDQACAHPNWDMGRKISVDSATLMNKGLEVIEAHWLFDLPRAALEVVVHPQSIVHSLVAYRDGSVLAQLGNPDMRTALAHALAYPDRVEAGVAPLDLVALGRLDFEAPDLELFPCLSLAFQALAAGGTAPAVLNAANEVAVQRFLDGALPFLAIPAVISDTMERLPAAAVDDLSGLLDCDRRAREVAFSAALRRAR